MNATDFSNPWIIAAGAAQRQARAWVTLAAACAVAVAAIMGGGWLWQAMGLALPPMAGQAVAYLILLGPFYVASAVAIGVIERRPWPKAGVPGAVSGVFGLVSGLIAFGVCVGLSSVSGVLKIGAPSGIGALGLAGMAGLTLFQVGAEEVLFRGWLQPVLCRHWGPWVGLLATSFVFALMHLINGPFSLVGVVNITFAGVVFGLLALRTGRLLGPILGHFAWNFTEANVVGLFPNPGVDGAGSVFNFDLIGPAWLGGAGDGLNQSILATVALALWLAGLVLMGGKTAARQD